MKAAVWAALIAVAGLHAQAPGTPEALSRWLFYKEMTPPRNATGLVDFVLDRDMLNVVHVGGADIRLYDASHREIPYVWRVRREIDTTNAFAAREFNRGVEGGAADVSYDLGEQTQQHNEVEIDSAGQNFRRLVEVQGSADGTQWSTLVAGAYLFQFAANGRTVEQKRIEYPVSRYRYLRVRVERDSLVDKGAPEITQVLIRRRVKVQGEIARFPATIEARDADRSNGRPASVWRLDFGGRVPVERLVLGMPAGAFSRPFVLEAVDDPATPVLLASGTLTRTEESTGQEETLAFTEHLARRVKLTVTDDRNAPLAIFSFTGEGAAREVVFQAGVASPVRAYYGNAHALAPHYDLAARMPPVLHPLRVVLGPEKENPEYRPDARPFTERAPWAVYVVLSVAVVALAWILMGLVKASRAASPAN